MATTIKLKNGSGAPLAGDLVQGEPALDLTNKRLYTEDSGGTVIEVGTNPTSLTTGTFTSTGIDDNATSTAITIDSSENVGIGTGSPSAKLNVDTPASGSGAIFRYVSGTNNPGLFIETNESSDEIRLNASGSTGGTDLVLQTASTERMRIDSSGNVGIGTSSPTLSANSTGIHIHGSGIGGSRLHLTDANTGTASTDGTEIVVAGSDLYIDQKEAASTILYTNGSERMRITSGGNVGIGTSSPSRKFHVNSGTANAVSVFESTDATAYIQLKDTAGSGAVGTTGSGNGLRFWLGDAATEAMRIDSSGNVGIGTSSPNSLLEVRGSSSGQNVLHLSNSAGASDGGAENQIRVTCNGNANWGNLDIQSYTTIFTQNGSERMRIDSSGNLLVGTTSTGGVTGGSSNGAYISGSSNSAFSRSATTNLSQIAFYNPNGFVGQISTSGSTTTYSTSSDERLKENIVDAPAGNIDAIRVRSFNWKADGTHQTYGMVAQELVDVAPEAVSQGETEDDMWAVDYSKLVPMMIKEIQDLKAKVKELESR